MNIKNRLKKIETQVIKADAEYCGCWHKYIETAFAENGVEVEETSPPNFEKDICDQCRKPFSIVDKTTAEKLVKTYGVTK